MEYALLGFSAILLSILRYASTHPFEIRYHSLRRYLGLSSDDIEEFPEERRTEWALRTFERRLQERTTELGFMLVRVMDEAIRQDRVWREERLEAIDFRKWLHDRAQAKRLHARRIYPNLCQRLVSINPESRRILREWARLDEMIGKYNFVYDKLTGRS
jgi:hypothetical protein